MEALAVIIVVLGISVIAKMPRNPYLANDVLKDGDPDCKHKYECCTDIECWCDDMEFIYGFHEICECGREKYVMSNPMY